MHPQTTTRPGARAATALPVLLLAGSLALSAGAGQAQTNTRAQAQADQGQQAQADQGQQAPTGNAEDELAASIEMQALEAANEGTLLDDDDAAGPDALGPQFRPQIEAESEWYEGYGTFAAAARSCWSAPRRWLLQAGGKDSDVVNLVICLNHGVTWSEVFSALEKLPGRKVVRRFAPDYLAPWRRVLHPVKVSDLLGKHCINPVNGNIDARGPRAQDFSAREGGCKTLFVKGTDHFRVWQQRPSMALFVAASTERVCRSGVKPTHCVISYDQGRELLFRNLAVAATKAHLRFSGGVYTFQSGGGRLKQADGSWTHYDGRARVVTLSR